MARLDVAGEEEGALVRGEQQLDEARAAAERAKEVWEAAVKGSTSLEVELQTLRAAKGRRSGDAGGEAARLRAELDAAHARARGRSGLALEHAREQADQLKRGTEAATIRCRRTGAEAESAPHIADSWRARSNRRREARAAKWEQECALQGLEGRAGGVGTR